MSASTKDYHYPVIGEARELDAADMEFIAEYTGRSADDLREHVLKVWQRIKQEVCMPTPRALTCPHFNFLDAAAVGKYTLTCSRDLPRVTACSSGCSSAYSSSCS